MAADITLSPEEATALAEKAFVAHRTSPETARVVAEALVAAEVDGQKGHGLSRVASYAGQAQSGKVDGYAAPTVARPTPGVVDVNAKLGFAYPALNLARGMLATAARETGVAVAAVKNSHHCGVLGHHVEDLAEQGFVAIMVANTPKAIAPAGGRAPFFGTNPIAFAAPQADGPPLVIDLALSTVARGKVMSAAKAGENIPEDWAIDAEGRPTTDPKAALGGAMLAAGRAKGAALALIVEVMAGALAGPSFSHEASDFFSAEGAPPALGQLLIAISADDAAQRRTAQLLTALAEQEGARVPGLGRLARRTEAARDGLRVASRLVDEIRRLAAGGGAKRPVAAVFSSVVRRVWL